MSPSPELAKTLARRTLELVSIPSPSGNEYAVAGHVEGFLREQTPNAVINRHGLGMVARFGTKEPLVVLAGHLDTVPPNGNPTPAIHDGNVVGLGATDMKGALAVMLTLAEAYSPEAGEPSPGTSRSLGLVFYDCEEVEFERNGLRTLFEREPWLSGASLALLLEPTDNKIELGCQGTLHARVTFHGTAAHSARPWTGKNAIHRAAPFLDWLAGAPVQEVRNGPAVYREVISATMAEGGSARNVIPDRFTVNVNFRFAPDRTLDDAEEYVRSIVPKDASVEIVDAAPAAPPQADTPLLKRLIEDFSLEIGAKQGWTDVAQFAEMGVPAANFGPGIPELAHKRDELVPIKNLVKSYELLAVFLGIANGLPERRENG
jgi:succinyl-diaminopimelate desuccinylase